jgi:hypothetical protein
VPRYDDDYPYLRASLRSDGRFVSGEDLEDVTWAELGLPAEDVEDFLSSLASFGQRALPGIVQGAATGSALGPWGALIGGVGGGLASALTGPGGPAAPRPAVARPPQAQPPAAIAPAPVAAAAPAPTLPANGAGALLGLLSRPEVMQALTALALGNRGTTSVAVGNAQVPTAAIASLVSQLAAQSAAGANAAPRESDESIPSYLLGEDGECRVDVSCPRQRAAALHELFVESAEGLFDEGEPYDSYDEGYDEADYEADYESDGEAYYEPVYAGGQS